MLQDQAYVILLREPAVLCALQGAAKALFKNRYAGKPAGRDAAQRAVQQQQVQQHTELSRLPRAATLARHRVVLPTTAVHRPAGAE